MGIKGFTICLVLLTILLVSLAVVARSVSTQSQSSSSSTSSSSSESCSTFILARHGFRGPNSVTPQSTLEIGDPVIPSSVPMPSYGAVYEGNLLNQTLSHTLPSVVKASIKKPGCVTSYADAAFSRCWATAVGWSHELGGCSICGVPAKPELPVDPRVNHHAAEVNVTDTAQWIADQQTTATGLAAIAQCHFSKLLFLLGFDQSLSSVPPSSPTDAKGRALQFLGLPDGTFEFCTAIVMAFGVVGKTALQVLRAAKWPKPRECCPSSWLAHTTRVLGIVLDVIYPPGYVGNTMSAPVSQLALQTLKHEGRTTTLACTHEEHLNFWPTALGVGSPTFYPMPVTALILQRKGEQSCVDVWVVDNEVSHGKAVNCAKRRHLGQVPLDRIQALADIPILPLPQPICISTFGNSKLC